MPFFNHSRIILCLESILKNLLNLLSLSKKPRVPQGSPFTLAECKCQVLIWTRKLSSNCYEIAVMLWIKHVSNGLVTCWMLIQNIQLDPGHRIEWPSQRQRHSGIQIQHKLEKNKKNLLNKWNKNILLAIHFENLLLMSFCSNIDYKSLN